MLVYTFRWLTFCFSRVSFFFMTFIAYTFPVCFSFTRWTSPKWPRPITFFSSKSPTFTRIFLSLVTTGWSINRNQKLQNVEIHIIYYALHVSTKFTVCLSFFEMSELHSSYSTKRASMRPSLVSCRWSFSPSNKFLRPSRICWRTEFLTHIGSVDGVVIFSDQNGSC